MIDKFDYFLEMFLIALGIVSMSFLVVYGVIKYGFIFLAILVFTIGIPGLVAYILTLSKYRKCRVKMSKYLNKISCQLRLVGKVTYADYTKHLATLTKQERDALTIDLTLRLEQLKLFFQPLMIAGMTLVAYVVYQLFFYLFTEATLSDNVRNGITWVYGISGILLYLLGVFLVLTSHLNTKRKLMILEQFERSESVG